MLKPRNTGVFTEEIKNYRREKEYWRKLLRSGNQVTHTILKRMWEGHEARNWRLNAKDIEVKIREVQEKIRKL